MNKSENICFNSHIRLLHAIEELGAVDVYLNDEIVTKNLNYMDFTEYVTIESGPYNLKIYSIGDKTDPIIDLDIQLTANQISTLAAAGNLEEFGIVEIPEYKSSVNPDMASVRFIHLSSTAPAVDVYLNNTLAFQDISFRELTNYIYVTPDLYDLKINLAGTNDTVLQSGNAKFLKNNYYTIYVIGNVGEENSLKFLLPLDGITYITTC